jgi:hypothetical protein
MLNFFTPPAVALPKVGYNNFFAFPAEVLATAVAVESLLPPFVPVESLPAFADAPAAGAGALAAACFDFI